jgi:hypothetical protein
MLAYSVQSFADVCYVRGTPCTLVRGGGVENTYPLIGGGVENTYPLIGGGVENTYPLIGGGVVRPVPSLVRV